MARVIYTPIQERMHELGLRASASDENLGLPDHSTWIAEDQACADSAAWEALVERREAVVLVGAKIETVIVPRHRSVLDRIRDLVPVTIEVRADGEQTGTTLSATLGRRPVSEMRTAPVALAA